MDVYESIILLARKWNIHNISQYESGWLNYGTFLTWIIKNSLLKLSCIFMLTWRWSEKNFEQHTIILFP